MSVSLNFLLFGEEKFRFLVVREVNSECHIMAPQRHVKDISELAIDEFPIFLARDAFKLVGEHSSGGMSRFLNKSQELQACVKVSFNGTRVEGINNSVIVNFITMKAMFRALFSGSNTYLQKLMASKLWDLWMRCCDKELPAAMKYPPASAIAPYDIPPIHPVTTNRAQLLDDLLFKLDSTQQSYAYSSRLRSLLNSLRSLCIKLADEEIGEVLTTCDELVQSLIEYDVTQGMESAILDVTSGWLGRAFSAMNCSVHQAVEKFKSENIDSIGSLPSARTTCSHFPKPMLTLFENWLHSWQEDGCETPSKRSRTDEAGIYRFIQLLLEFSNNTLISGVAHVVYTQLLKDPT